MDEGWMGGWTNLSNKSEPIREPVHKSPQEALVNVINRIQTSDLRDIREDNT